MKVLSQMSSNRLRLNLEKTKFLWLGTRQVQAGIDKEAIKSIFQLWKVGCPGPRSVSGRGPIYGEVCQFPVQFLLYQLHQIRVTWLIYFSMPLLF